MSGESCDCGNCQWDKDDDQILEYIRENYVNEYQEAKESILKNNEDNEIIAMTKKIEELTVRVLVDEQKIFSLQKIVEINNKNMSRVVELEKTVSDIFNKYLVLETRVNERAISIEDINNKLNMSNCDD